MRCCRALFHRPWFPLALASLAVVSIVGCGDGEVKRYPVKGSVTVDGKPADGAMVIFCPNSDSSPEIQRKRPFGFTGPDGHFELTTLTKKDGSPAGEYKVLIQWPTAGAGDSRDGPHTIGPDRLKGKYMNLEQCTLTAKITDGPAELPPFDLKSK